VYAPSQGLLLAWPGPSLRLRPAKGKTPLREVHRIGDECAKAKFYVARAILPGLMASQVDSFHEEHGGGAKSMGGTPYLSQSITV
jgi:hypothetical protein